MSEKDLEIIQDSQINDSEREEDNYIPESKVPPQLRKYAFTKGNPGGGKKGKRHSQLLSTLLRDALKQKVDIENPLTLEVCRITASEAIMLKLMKRALSGNLKAIEMIFDRIDGKVADQLQLANAEDKPFEISAGPRHDFSKLSIEELTTMRSLLGKTSSVPMLSAPEDEGNNDDVPDEEVDVKNL